MRSGWGIFGIALLFALLLSNCAVHDLRRRNDTRLGISGTPAPSRIYEPRYYVYKNGRYTFVGGKYRRIWFPRAYYKRSLRGFIQKNDYAAAR